MSDDLKALREAMARLQAEEDAAGGVQQPPQESTLKDKLMELMGYKSAAMKVRTPAPEGAPEPVPTEPAAVDITSGVEQYAPSTEMTPQEMEEWKRLLEAAKRPKS